MRNTFYTVSLFSSLFFTLLIESHADHFRVYLLGGQSNANGRGDASQLTEPLASPQSDVRFYWHRTQVTSNVGWLSEDQWIDLAPGSGHGTTTPVHAREFGSELSFGRAMADADPTVNIAIIKYTHGGTNLHTQWAAGGTQYTTFVTTVHTALATLITSGHSYEWGGMIWHQGESDTGNVSNANRYQANLSNLVTRIRQEVASGFRLPFVVAGLSDSQNTSINTPGSGWYIVRQAQEAVALNMERVGFANTDGISVFASAPIHLDHVGQVTLGQAFATQMLLLEAYDADRDGLLTDEELALGTFPNNPDSDDDGMYDGAEIAAGTDPLNDQSFFELVDLSVSGDEVTFTWPSKPGNVYAIERSTGLLGWQVIASGVTAATTGSVTRWTGSVGPSNVDVLALYDVSTGIDGNFNTTAYESVDTHVPTTAGRLVQGGSLTGGGSSFVLSHALFAPSDSGSPGFNFADVNTADRTSAKAAGDYFSFTLASEGTAVTYKSLSFFTDQFGSAGTIDVSYSINDTETFVREGLIPPGGNAPTVRETIDFTDFETTNDVTWTFYLYGGDTTGGIRFDDITLRGETPSESAARIYLRARLERTSP